METVKITLTCPHCGHDEFVVKESGAYKCTRCGNEEYPENMTAKEEYPEDMTAKTVQQWQHDYPQEFTEITAICCYQNGKRTKLFGPIYAVHKHGDILEMVDECCTQWFLTKEGAEAYERSFHEYNMGDWMNGLRPDDTFTKKFGFVCANSFIVATHSQTIMFFDHDRLLGTEPEYSDDE